MRRLHFLKALIFDPQVQLTYKLYLTLEDRCDHLLIDTVGVMSW